MRKLLTTVPTALSLVLLAGSFNAAFAVATPEEAALLKTTLTPLGAERAGNKDGTIPAWTGGLTSYPAGYVPGTMPVPDPYGDEKPVLEITPQNVDQYKDKLFVGVQEWFKRYPEFKVLVYPTHRTVAAPQWVYDNTFLNATRARSLNNGLTIENVYGGTPFPIPKSGIEVMWNHQLRWKGEATSERMAGVSIGSDGAAFYSIRATFGHQTPYYDKDSSLEKFQGYYDIFTTLSDDPPAKAGQATLGFYPLDQYAHETQSWQYLPGQRRVRKAPNLAYDTPNFFSSGIGQFDETDGFQGSFDRYNWKLIGKREMYIPYNLTKTLNTDYRVGEGPHYIKPEYQRFELHRVWLVEATLAPDKTNVVARRMMYIDEDGWSVVAADEWDANNSYWRLIMMQLAAFPDIPAVTDYGQNTFDFHSNACGTQTFASEGMIPLHAVPKQPMDNYTAEHLAAGLGR